MKSVKVIGAGSIGNHLSHASRSLGWHVDLCDADQAALERTRDSIYPGRYGDWDSDIKLHTMETAPRGGHDLIVIGTPPDTHLDVARAALDERPRAMLVEKPLCTPDLTGAQAFFDAAKDAGVDVFVGYDHVVGQSARETAAIAGSGMLGPLETLDVEFREHWGGIFNAHPWLDGPADSYLGFWRRGGGASGEHSHAANLWQYFASVLGAGRIVDVTATIDYETTGSLDYDKLCLMSLRTENGLVGRVVQDVVTQPARKWARIQGRDGFVEWRCGAKPGCDTVVSGVPGEQVDEIVIEKTRPDDFIRELEHIAAAMDDGDDTLSPGNSPISLARGLDTMLVVAAAHKSARERRTVTINYDAGYSEAALIIAEK